VSVCVWIWKGLGGGVGGRGGGQTVTRTCISIRRKDIYRVRVRRALRAV
jgi:hypothetical protein